jgi:hypothetical protein
VEQDIRAGHEANGIKHAINPMSDNIGVR